MSEDKQPTTTFYNGELITLISFPGDPPVYRNRQNTTIVRTQDLLKSEKVQNDLSKLKELRESYDK